MMLTLRRLPELSDASFRLHLTANRNRSSSGSLPERAKGRWEHRDVEGKGMVGAGAAGDAFEAWPSAETPTECAREFAFGMFEADG